MKGFRSKISKKSFQNIKPVVSYKKNDKNNYIPALYSSHVYNGFYNILTAGYFVNISVPDDHNLVKSPAAHIETVDGSCQRNGTTLL